MSSDFVDLLGVSLGSEAPQRSQLAPTNSQSDAFDFDFNPDAPSVPPAHTPVPPAPAAPIPSQSNNGSRDHGSSTASVDPEELRRRIRGEGSEKPSSLQRMRAVAADAASGATARIRGVATLKMTETPRWKFGVVLLLLLLCLGALYWRRSPSDVTSEERVASDEVIVTGAAKVPPKSERKSASRPRADAERKSRDEDDSSEKDDDVAINSGSANADADGESEASSASFRSSAPAKDGASLAAVTKELASLRRAVLDSTSSLRSEITSLREEVSRLRRSSPSRDSARSTSSRDSEDTQSDRQSKSEDSAPQAKASSEDDESVGEIRKETRTRPSFSSRQSRAASASKTASARSEASSDDSDIGALREIVTR